MMVGLHIENPSGQGNKAIVGNESSPWGLGLGARGPGHVAWSTVGPSAWGPGTWGRGQSAGSRDRSPEPRARGSGAGPEARGPGPEARAWGQGPKSRARARGPRPKARGPEVSLDVAAILRPCVLDRLHAKHLIPTINYIYEYKHIVCVCFCWHII